MQGDALRADSLAIEEARQRRQAEAARLDLQAQLGQALRTNAELVQQKQTLTLQKEGCQEDLDSMQALLHDKNVSFCSSGTAVVAALANAGCHVSALA